MAMSKEFKSLGESKQRVLVGKIKRLIDQGKTEEDIIKELDYMDENLIIEGIEMVKVAIEYQKTHLNMKEPI